MVRTRIEKQSVHTTTLKQPRNASPHTPGPTPDPRPSYENTLPGPTFEEIAVLAYSYWDTRNGDAGSADDDWLRAERELSLRNTNGPGPKLERRRGRSASAHREQSREKKTHAIAS